jgi:sugar phosphate isomerase/epimerase
MLAISTSWMSGGCDDGEGLLRRLERFGIRAVELDYRITAAMHRQAKGLLGRAGFRVVSVHNFFPVPPIVPRSMAGGDVFSLSSPDGEERMRAVEWTMRTIEAANDLEAGAVVLHCGRLDEFPGVDGLREFRDRDMIECEEARELARGLRGERDAKKRKSMDCLLSSLDRLVRTADSMNVTLGLENRRLFHELPGADDFEAVFREFDGAPLGLWFNAGGAKVNELLGLFDVEGLLKTFSSKLIGAHLHDARKGEDHLPPGTGAVDFAMIRSHLPDGAPGVLELAPGASDGEVSESIAYLREVGMDV